ncbi:MAG TPA: DUF3299 domain-containing protein [Acidobacteriota bacterium]|nr:DUF3299 domain-containing protein [Acidobacteriota bacterium]HNJ43644.1 DUF3299 domain-containing protein [Acidobacteriota bacterium]
MATRSRWMIFGMALTLALGFNLGLISTALPTTTVKASSAVAGATPLRIRDLAGVKVVQQAVQFPTKANELNGKLVEVNGFMVPLGLGGNKLKRFVLIEVPLSCCFADGPGIDGMLYVTLAPGKELDTASDFPISVVGKFEAGVVRNQYGQVESVYRITGASARKLVQ